MKKIMTFGEIMQRLTPSNYDRLDQCTTLQVTYGGSEANIAIALANFGHDVTFATKVPNNTLGYHVKRMLNKYGINTEHVLLEGDILGLYYVEQGFSLRPSSVIYNRKYSEFAKTKRDDFDVTKMLDGKHILHISGITLALGDELRRFTLDLVKKAFEKGLTISFDFNYRAKLWSVDEAAQAIRKILPYVHICFASMYDLEVIGGYEVLEDYHSIEQKRHAVFTKFMEESNCQYIFGTQRTHLSTNRNQLKAYCYTSTGVTHTTNSFEFEIVDRVGGGDAFVAGVLNTLDTSQDNFIEAVEFGLACGVIKHTINGDVLLTTQEEVEEFIKSSGCVGIKR